MRRRGEVLLPPVFQPPEADVEFTAAQLALIEIGRRQSGLTNPVDALNFALALREIAERSQRGVIDEITANVGQKNRDNILESEIGKRDITLARFQKLAEDPPAYQALMKMRRQAGNVDIDTAAKFLAEDKRRRREHAAAMTDKWSAVFNSSKPGRGDDWRQMDKLGPMVAAEIKAEKQAKAALKKRQKDNRKLPKSPKDQKKISWRQNPGFRKAALHFAATGRGIVPDKLKELNHATGREAEVLEAERQLDLAGFPWPDGET